MENSTYYQDQINQINLETGFASTLQIVDGNGNRTKHLGINDESAKVLVKWLQTNFIDKKPTKMKAEEFNIFTEKQLEAIKLIIIKGGWGDCDMKFGTNKECNDAYGYFTNMDKSKEFSGLMSGIAKTIKKSGTTAIKMCSDWWGDGSGDMMFFNMDLLECNANELGEWANK